MQDEVEHLLKQLEDGGQSIHWLKSIFSPRRTLLVIDMQNDFLTGSLALRAAPAGQDGLEILEPLNAFLDEASDNFDKIGLYNMLHVLEY